MSRISVRPRFWMRFLPLVVVAMLAVALVGTALADKGADYAIPSGWFYTQTGGGQGNGYAVRDTGVDSSGNTTKFWTEFQRLGAVTTLGYPVGQPYVGSDGFTYQAFQRGVLQWRPELGRALLSNTFEILQTAMKDDWLDSTKGIPRPITDDGSGGDYNKAVAIRLGWMTNDAIKAKFLANPNPAKIANWNLDAAIELYGLPMSRPEKRGPFIVQRFQRISFQDWIESVSGMPSPGSVVGILGGDLLKEAGLLPANAVQPLGPDGTASTSPTVVLSAVPTVFPTATQPAIATFAPTATFTATPLGTTAPTATMAPTLTSTPAPQGNYTWTVASIQGWPNCGTTYIRAYTRDANGNGVNGLTLKSYNDYGNVYIAGTRNYNGKDGYWDRVVGPGVRAGRWYVVMLDGAGNQASTVATIDFTGSCDPNGGNVQEAEVIFQSR